MAKRKRPLTNFVKKLYNDPKLVAKLRANPKAALGKSRLSTAHKKIVLSGDPKKIGYAMVDEHVETQPSGKKIGPLTMCLLSIVINRASTM